MATHDLYYRAALMRLHRIPEFVNALQRRIAGGIEPYGITGAANVVINGTGHSHYSNPMLGQGLQTAVSTVAPQADDTV